MCQLAGRFRFFPVTGITLPGELDFVSLGQLLTFSTVPAIRHVPFPGRELYMFSAAIAQAFERMAADDLADIAVAWAQTAPWAGLEVNPVDLAGFPMELKANWHRSATPDKALFLWLDA
ncbi:hypothetical protein JAB5_08190 [Janthinobacterium sp. HH103]|uniref:hypothetical protein n=1 Tax=unclassified Janthinobacterium TaxID=2610881 RepID=UPI000874C552|nr:MULTISPECIES: hypothetical protein [unclassified Janthinobacterium]OEZ54168.1 hypothetical protein JAB2_55190 [Janthinobacterium sp. HH100]OEZ85774.1 hypothetical protein JAB5_08190 [Janthinobacterium sp. HH103]QOU73521.1 hypothetical protein JAB4_029770 [Janthinobacterium sp. HH102]